MHNMASKSIADPPEPPLEETRNWLDLPEDVMAAIFRKVGVVDVLTSVQLVCTTWGRICKDPFMWRIIDLTDTGSCIMDDFDYEKMAKCAIDLSCGQLIEISIREFCTEELLEYIADRSSQLRRLSLMWSQVHDVPSSALEKLPLLEELHLHYTNISSATIETAGKFCPNLKSFKLSTYLLNNPLQGGCDDVAIIISKTMPRLRELQLFGNMMTNVGLCAILDGCLSLESLDLRKCYNVDLSRDLKKRCVNRIGDMKLPCDSIKDFEFDHYYSDFSSDSCCGDPYGLEDVLLDGLDDDFSDGFFYDDEYDIDDYDDYDDYDDSLLFW